MEVAFRNFYLCRTHIRLRNLELSGLSLQKNYVRQLRGSRSGKNGKGDDVFQSILKNLKGHFNKPAVITTDQVIISDDPSNDSSKVPEKTKASVDDVYKKLQEKITPFKDVRYTYQLEKKYKMSIGVLRYLGEKLQALKVPIALGQDNLPCPVDLTVQSPLIESYRNQDEFSVGLGPDGNSKTVGFFTGNNSDGTNSICLSPEDLTIIKESHKEFAKDFQNYVNNSPLEANVRYDDGGYWRSLKIRSNTEEHLMGIITMHPQQLTKEDLIEEAEKLREYFLAQKPYYLKSLYLQTCEQKSSDFKLDLLLGDSCIVESFNNLKLQISPCSYFPSNTRSLECAYNSLMKVCRINESTTVLDIFCGTGPLSLMMSPRVKQCIGIDSCLSNIQDAKANAIRNEIKNAHFVGGDIDLLINKVLSKDFYEDLVAVINPARTELTKTAIQCLRQCKHLKKIVYMTTIPKSAVGNYVRLCKPSGASGLYGKYFVPLLAIPVDLFPQTDRFGLIVMFQRL